MSATFDLNGCQVFQTGRWNNDVYTEADLDAMVASFGQVGFVPPLKLGHDASQPLAKSDGMPAIGWVYNLRRVGTKLLCDIRQMPKKVYDAVKRKNYDRVSAEVYWDYDLNGKVYPRVLKALSLLGAEIPAVTSLAALEALYDASGKEFKRYDMFYPDSPSASTPQMMPMMGEPDDEDEGEKKGRETVNYRPGDAAYCGGCRFWCGPLDPKGAQTLVACCSLVEGQLASSMLCDLHEVAEPFATTLGKKTVSVEIVYGKPDEKVYMVEKRGAKWVLISKTTGEVLGEHDTEEEAIAQERAVQAGKSKKETAMSASATEEIANNSGESAGGSEDEIMDEEQKMKIAELTANLAAQEAENAGLKTQVSDLSGKVTEFSEKLPVAEARAAELEAEKAALAEQARQDGKKAWFAALTTEANLKILPVEKPIVEFLYEMLDGGAVKTYKADDGKELSSLDTLKSLFEGRTPGTFLFKELSSSSSTQDAGKPAIAEMSASEAKQELTNMAKAYMAEKKEKSFQVALKVIYAANPELMARSAGITPQGEAKEEAGISSRARMFRQ